jgi:ribokinase
MISYLIGSLAAYLSRGISIAEALQRSIECASMSVTKRGAQSKYPKNDELELHLRLAPRLK